MNFFNGTPSHRRFFSNGRVVGFSVTNVVGFSVTNVDTTLQEARTQNKFRIRHEQKQKKSLVRTKTLRKDGSPSTGPALPS